MKQPSLQVLRREKTVAQRRMHGELKKKKGGGKTEVPSLHSCSGRSSVKKKKRTVSILVQKYCFSFSFSSFFFLSSLEKEAAYFFFFSLAFFFLLGGVPRFFTLFFFFIFFPLHLIRKRKKKKKIVRSIFLFFSFFFLSLSLSLSSFNMSRGNQKHQSGDGQQH